MKAKSKVFILVFVILLILGLAIATTQTTKNSDSRKKAPDFTLTTFKGNKITLNKLKDKPVVINIWASWCGPCRKEAPELEKFWRKYNNKIYFIGINYADKKEDALAFIKKNKITFENGPDSNIAKKYRITGVPETFIIKDGLIYDHIIGTTTAEVLSQKIEALL